MTYRSQRVRDPVHNLIVFGANKFEDMLWKVIQTRPFQRLRRIKQLGFSELVYPGATHTRFAHSIGVFHTARKLMEVIRAHAEEHHNYDPDMADAALAAALVHDLGHGPFSHAFESVGERLSIKMADHENVSDALIREGEVAQALKSRSSGFANDVADIIKSDGPRNMYSAVVSSQFDADRLDYIRRDRLMTGTQLGAIDFHWLVANLEIGSVKVGVDEKPLGVIDTFVVGPKAIYAAEAYVLGLFQLYPTVYFHKATRGAERLFEELLFRVISHVKSGSISQTGLSSNHPLVKFAKAPDKIESVLCLDDTVVWGALSIMIEAKDSLISDFSQRLRDRRLFKCIDVRQRVGQQLDGAKVDTTRFEKVCEKIDVKISNWVSSKSKTRAARVLIDRVERDPYRQFQESKGPLNQIRIRTSEKKLVDLGVQSAIVKAIKPFKAFRIYVAEEDMEARAAIEKIVASGGK